MNGKCNEWNGEGYFCNSGSAKSCNYDRSAKSQCGIDPNIANLDPQYQYFSSDPQKGGVDILADYCPYYIPTSNGLCSDTSQNGQNIIDQGAFFSTESKCYDTSLAKDSPSAVSTVQNCYSSKCTNETSLKVKIGEYWYDCPFGGTVSDVGPYVGTLTCPSTSSICSGSMEDDTWPSFESIDPDQGPPGIKLTIKGKYIYLRKYFT